MAVELFSEHAEERGLRCGKVCFRRLGAGPNLILLHGLLGSGWQWKATAQLLASRFTCWVLELPGISGSQRVEDGSLAGLANWLDQVVRELAIGRFCLLGSSWGGAVALELASSGDRLASVSSLERLVLAAPANPFWSPSRRQRWLLWPPLTRVALGCAGWASDDFYRRMLAAGYGRSESLPEGAVGRYRRLLRRPGLSRALTGYARHWRRDQARLGARLAAIRTPALLVWGSRDAVVPFASAPALREHVPGCGCVLLPGLGHFPYEEDPAAFVNVIEPFLA